MDLVAQAGAPVRLTQDPPGPADPRESGRRGSNPRPSAWKADALPTELRPRAEWWGKDSNLRRLTPADLQSAPFGHSGTPPRRPRCRSPKSVFRPPAPPPPVTTHPAFPKARGVCIPPNSKRVGAMLFLFGNVS